MSYRARIVIDVADPEAVERLMQEVTADSAVSFVIALDGIDIGVDGEMIRHLLKPLLVEATTLGARPRKGPTERRGPLVRIHATRPTEEEHGDHERTADAAGA